MELRIKELCKEKGLRMSDLADKMSINQANLASSLKGNPTLSRLQDVANVLGVEIYELFMKPSQLKSRLNGFVEINGEIMKLQTEDDWLSATEKVSGIAEPRLYHLVSELRKDVESYVHGMQKEYNSERLLSGRLGRHEIFTLSCSEEALQDEAEGELMSYNFHLCLVRKNIVIQYSTLEFGYGDVDLDSSQGLIQNIINDLEWPLESSDSACEFWD